MLLPTPRHVRFEDGVLRLPAPLPIRGGGPGARLLSERLGRAAGVSTTTGDGVGVDFHREKDLCPEAYRLLVSREGVQIFSGDDSGEGWAVQTLLQLLPTQVGGPGPMEPDDLTLPCVDIEDEPAFAWRGSMIDVARHFLPLDGLLKHLDVMAAHKLNVLHLHLTDDQGWRVPVAKYPRLTEAGALRPGTLPGHQPPPDEDDRDDFPQHDGRPHGGHYTVEEIGRLVARAAELGITIMPEIDMPGHMEAAIAAYPELGACDHVKHPRTCFGISDHVLALTDQSVQFCKDVLDTVIGLFPGSPIHIGGDECPSVEWFSDPASQALMAHQGITTGQEAQAWFERQICEHVLAAGRRPVAWDEVLELGAPEGITVMAWRDRAAISEAAVRGFDVIAAPVQYTYLDYGQYDAPDQPVTIGGPTTLEQVAGFADELRIDDAAQPHVLGGQFQLWTEYVHTWGRAETLLWPRGSSLAQQLWAGSTEGADSLDGLGRHLQRLTAMEVNWCREPIDTTSA